MEKEKALITQGFLHCVDNNRHILVAVQGLEPRTTRI